MKGLNPKPVCISTERKSFNSYFAAVLHRIAFSKDNLHSTPNCEEAKKHSERKYARSTMFSHDVLPAYDSKHKPSRSTIASACPNIEKVDTEIADRTPQNSRKISKKVTKEIKNPFSIYKHIKNI